MGHFIRIWIHGPRRSRGHLENLMSRAVKTLSCSEREEKAAKQGFEGRLGLEPQRREEFACVVGAGKRPTPGENSWSVSDRWTADMRRRDMSTAQVGFLTRRGIACPTGGPGGVVSPVHELAACHRVRACVRGEDDRSMVCHLYLRRPTCSFFLHARSRLPTAVSNLSGRRL